eukprot:m.159828 g.159828  ORF g.159828 m.159828 type:complete len:64 (-) comp10267_c0_seq13:258-449(-)
MRSKTDMDEIAAVFETGDNDPEDKLEADRLGLWALLSSKESADIVVIHCCARTASSSIDSTAA